MKIAALVAPSTSRRGAIALTERAAAGDPVGSGSAVSFTATPSADGTSVVLTFPGGTGGSLANGVYDLTVHMGLVDRQSDGTPLGGGDQVKTFYRYFGDAFGTGNVTAADYNLFKKALKTYNPIFDYNRDGVIDSTTDYPAFTADFSGSGYDLYTLPAAGTTQVVAYAYGGGANASRLTSMTYPNGRVEDYAYGAQQPIVSISSSGTTATATYAGANQFSVGDTVVITGSAASAYDGTFTITAINTGSSTFTFTLGTSYTGSDSSVDILALNPAADPLDNAISRVSAIQDHAGSSAGTVAAYTYLGFNTIVQEAEPQINTGLTYIEQPGDSNAITDGGDRYTGLDRFGRVDDQYYLNTSTGTALDRLQYGYDRDGNVLYAKNLVNGSFSELYHANSAGSGDDNSAYDPLSRIASFSRGTLTSSGNNGSTPDTITSGNLNSTSGVPNQNSWNLDALGNWSSGAGSSNTFNSQNEETTTNSGGTTLAYDNAGDMTTDELGNAYLYDAWGRVVQISSGSGAVLAALTYDALGRNVVLRTPGTASGSGYALIAYDAAGRQAQSSYTAVYSQYVWGLAYVNDLVLRDSYTGGNLGLGNNAGLNQREYAQHDSQFSVISVTDSGGNVTQRFVYDPYGKATPLTASWAYDSYAASYGPAGQDDWRVQFQGMMLINDGPGGGNVEQSEGRIDDVVIGRWLSQDPVGFADGVNRYEELLDNPPRFIDPGGTKVATAPMPPVAKFPTYSKYTSFIPGRGTFTATLIRNDDFSSDMTIQFNVDPIVRKNCLCDEIAFAQIIYERTNTTANFSGGRLTANWGLDNGDPYPYPSDPPNHWFRTGASNFAKFTDQPGSSNAFRAWENGNYYQIFVTTAYCRKGKELGKSYGSLVWGHFWQYDSGIVVRMLEGAGIEAGDPTKNSARFGGPGPGIHNYVPTH